jgi:putative addiction module CopG family antidote
MKERASFTFDKETLKLIDELVNSGRYRNKSHVVEAAIKFLKEKEGKGGERA